MGVRSLTNFNYSVTLAFRGEPSIQISAPCFEVMSPEETQSQLPVALSFLPTNEGGFIHPLGFCANEASELISTRTHPAAGLEQRGSAGEVASPLKIVG